MKICFPVESVKGLESEVYGHFGSAPSFVVFDTDSKSIESISNQNLEHEHGKCNPLQALDGKMVDAVVVGGMGAGAINKLKIMGVKVYIATPGNIQDNLKNFENDELAELTAQHVCGCHSGGCGH